MPRGDSRAVSSPSMISRRRRGSGSSPRRRSLSGRSPCSAPVASERAASPFAVTGIPDPSIVVAGGDHAVHATPLDGPRSRTAPGLVRGRARPGRGARPARRRRRRVAKLRRRRRQHQVLAARPDRRRQLRRSRGRLALAVGRRVARSRPVARAGPAPRHPDVPGDAVDGRRRRLHLDGAAPGGGNRRRERRDDLGARPAGLPRRAADPLLQLARGSRGGATATTPASSSAPTRGT